MGKSTFLKDFKAFAMKGNVVDMAVGVIIGGAAGYVYKAKKKGQKCIGCPSGGCCNGSDQNGCNCHCGQQ